MTPRTWPARQESQSAGVRAVGNSVKKPRFDMRHGLAHPGAIMNLRTSNSPRRQQQRGAAEQS